MLKRKFPLGVYVGDQSARLMLPQEAAFLHAVDQSIEAGKALLYIHDSQGGQCDCIICNAVRPALFNFETASGCVESNLVGSWREEEESTPQTIPAPAVEPVPTAGKSWPDSNPANPPGAERLADALAEALEAIKELEQAEADGWEDDLMAELPGVAWTLNNLDQLLGGMMAPYGEDLSEMLARLSNEHSERMRIIYEHEGKRGPVCPDGQCWICDRRREEQEATERFAQLARQKSIQAEACEPVFVAGRSA